MWATTSGSSGTVGPRRPCLVWTSVMACSRVLRGVAGPDVGHGRVAAGPPLLGRAQLVAEVLRGGLQRLLVALLVLDHLAGADLLLLDLLVEQPRLVVLDAVLAQGAGDVGDAV